MTSIYKTYYDYRRYIYLFRNLYVPIMLNISTEYHKMLHQEWQKNMLNRDIIDVLTVSVGLVEKVIAFPFTLTMHEFEADDEHKDGSVGLSPDIYYPPCFRNVLCDRSYIEMLFEFFFFLLKELESVNQLGGTVYSMLKIAGRIISASSYTFSTEE